MSRRLSRVFISYSHDSPAHNARVLALAQALRSNGVDAVLDQYHEDEMLEWPKWYLDQMRDAGYVLCVCTPAYEQLASGAPAAANRRSIAWGIKFLKAEVDDAKGQRRFIPVLFDDEPETSIPDYLRGWTRCRLRGFTLADAGYLRLLRVLAGVPGAVPQRLGTLPDLTAIVEPATGAPRRGASAAPDAPVVSPVASVVTSQAIFDPAIVEALGGIGRSEDVPGTAAAVSTPAPPTVYLALGTPDTAKLRERLRRFLEERGCTVLPAAPYPPRQRGRQLHQDMEKSAAFIQLVGQRAEPEGFDRIEDERAREYDRPRLRRRDPEIEAGNVAPERRDFLFARDVIACGFEDFKKHVADELGLVMLPPSAADEPDTGAAAPAALPHPAQAPASPSRTPRTKPPPPLSFVSFSSRDRELVLSELAMPFAREGIELHLVDMTSRVDESLSDIVRTDLERCPWFLVVVTPHAIASEWVQSEVVWALEHRPGKIVVLRAADCDVAHLNLQLNRLRYIDFRADYAQAREMLRLIWRPPQT